MDTKFLKKCGINIRAASVGFCSDELRYNLPDSHHIQIPEQLFNNFMDRSDLDKPLFIGICNSQKTNLCLYFGRVEPTLRTENSSGDMCLLPDWVMNKLELDLFGDFVDIEIMREGYHIKKLGYIKIRCNVSSYSKWDNIKELLEIKIGSYNCVNTGDEFHIDDVIFTIVQLKDHEGNIIECGSTYQTETNLDFEIPDDLRELEYAHRKEMLDEEEKRIQYIKEKKNISVDTKESRHIKFGAHISTLNDDTKEETKHEYFTGKGLKLSDNSSNRILTREERAELIMKRIQEENS